MHDNRDDYEPIIADRRSREPLPEETQPLWRLVLALGGGLAIVVVIALWWMGRASNEVASTTAESEIAAPEIFPEERIEQMPAPPARDSQMEPEVPPSPASPAPAVDPPVATEQPSIPEPIPEVTPDNAAPSPKSPATVSVRLTSPDTQVQIELRPLDSSTPVTSKVGDVVALTPGTYRMVASGVEFETFEQEVTFEGDRSVEYSVELCVAERKHERESLAGRVVEERECATTAQCESMFMVLSEHADQLVNDRAFRTRECAKWRPDAAPEGKWTLNTDCGGATLATTCRIEIAGGACTFAEPRRSVRGTTCPRAELK